MRPFYQLSRSMALTCSLHTPLITFGFHVPFPILQLCHCSGTRAESAVLLHTWSECVWARVSLCMCECLMCLSECSVPFLSAGQRKGPGRRGFSLTSLSLYSLFLKPELASNFALSCLLLQHFHRSPHHLISSCLRPLFLHLLHRDLLPSFLSIIVRISASPLCFLWDFTACSHLAN